MKKTSLDKQSARVDRAVSRKLAVGRMIKELAKQAGGDWAVTTGLGYHDGSQGWADQDGAWIRFERDRGIAVVLNVSKPQGSFAHEWAFGGLTIEGHTTYDGRCFTHFGVDTCSCSLTDNTKWVGSHTYASLDALLAGELA